MQIEWFVAIVVGLIGVVFLVSIGFAINKILRDFKTQGLVTGVEVNPGVEDVLEALAKYVYFGIASGERAVVWGVNQFEAYIDGEDKAAVANFWYDLFPEVVVVRGVPIPVNIVKALISRERWEAFVKSLYDEFNAKVNQVEDTLLKQIDAAKYAIDEEHPEDLKGEFDDLFPPANEDDPNCLK